MPQYKWYGIDIMGKTRSGVFVAHSHEELSSLLFQEQIALLRYAIKKPFPLIHTISLAEKITFFRQLRLLLAAGIYLDQALLLIMHQIKKNYFKAIIQDVLTDIQNGITLAHALRNYPLVFDELSIVIVQAGQESGTMVPALEELCTYQELFLNFKKKIRSILLMPFITFVFFVLIATIIIVVIVPRFNALFSSCNQSCSTSTAFIFLLSDFVRTIWFPIYSILAAIIITGISYVLKRSKVMLRAIEWGMVTIPILKTITHHITFVYYFQSLALLTKRGIHLVTALEIAQQSISNYYLRAAMARVQCAILEGASFATAIKNEKSLFPDQVVALLAVGHESACMPFVFEQIAQLYKEQINRTLTTLATLLQPLLMIILGLLITSLVFALYVPLFNLSSVIS